MNKSNLREIKFYLSLPLHDHFDPFNKKAMDQQKRGATAKQIDDMEDQLDSQLLTFDVNGDDDDEFENIQEAELTEDDIEGDALDDESDLYEEESDEDESDEEEFDEEEEVEEEEEIEEEIGI